MLLPKKKPLRNRKYLDSFRGALCMVCKSAESTVGCHIRNGSGAGIGTKPGDDLTVPLCHRHHAEQHRIGEKAFFLKYFGWTIKQAKKAAKDRYEAWRNG